MLLKIPSIAIDDVDIIKDIKVNLITKKSFRMKCVIIVDDVAENIDIAVKDFKPALAVTGVQILFSGIDMISKGSVSLTLFYTPFKRKWTLDGVYGSKEIHTVFASFNDVKELARQIKNNKEGI